MEVSATENERLAVRTPPAEKGAFHAFEYLISADDASATTLTFVHSGYLGDDWEGEFDFGEMIGFGWDMYLHTLAQYLTHLDSSPAHFVTAQGPPTSATPESWAVLEKALGVQGPFGQGQHLRLTPQGLPALEGVVDFAYPPVRQLPRSARPTTDGLYRFHHNSAMGLPQAVGHYIYADIDREATEQAWADWLGRVFA